MAEIKITCHLVEHEGLHLVLGEIFNPESPLYWPNQLTQTNTGNELISSGMVATGDSLERDDYYSNHTLSECAEEWKSRFLDWYKNNAIS